MNRTPPPEQPETTKMPSPSRVLTESVLADRTDSSGRIEFSDILSWLQDEPTTVQPHDAINQTPQPQQPETTTMPSCVLTEAVLADNTDSSERIDFSDTLMWIQDEPSAVHSKDVLFQMSPPEEPETTRMTTRVLTEAEVADVTDSSERIDCDDILLRQQDEPSMVLPQDVLFQMSPSEEPEMPSHVSTETEIVDSLGRINFDELTNVQPQNDVVQPVPRLRIKPRALTRAELDSCTDSSGVIDMFAVLLCQQNDPAQPHDDPSQQSEMPSLQDVFAAFTGISGRSEFDAFMLRYQSKDSSNLRGLPG